MKNKEHTRQVRDTVVKKFKAGFGYKKISQALNIPMSTVQAVIKLETLGLDPALCNWVLDFLTGRPQVMREVTTSPPR